MYTLIADNGMHSQTISRQHRKRLIATAITLAIGTATSTTSAGLSSGDVLQFVLGTKQTVACTYGTTPPCNRVQYNITDIVGSYFAFDTNGVGGITPNEKTPIQSFRGIVIGESQLASGSHSGPVDGSENPDIDRPWTFFAGTGMHQTTTPVNVLSDAGNTQLLDMSGWNVHWNGIPSIPMVPVGEAVVSCDSSCSRGENYTLDAAFHTNGAGFTTVPYSLHLEGVVGGPSEPLPPTKGVSIQLTGGNSQECASTGGNSVEATAIIRTTDINDIASISWSLDSGSAGSGNTVNVFTPLGEHTVSVFVDTLASGTFESSEQVMIKDLTPPGLKITFIDERSGLAVTEVTGNGTHFVKVSYDVTDICDPEPAVSGVAVPVHTVNDGDTMKISSNQILQTTLGTSAVNVTAEATDASGNQTRRESALVIRND